MIINVGIYYNTKHQTPLINQQVQQLVKIRITIPGEPSVPSYEMQVQPLIQVNLKDHYQQLKWKASTRWKIISFSTAFYTKYLFNGPLPGI